MDFPKPNAPGLQFLGASFSKARAREIMTNIMRLPRRHASLFDTQPFHTTPFAPWSDRLHHTARLRIPHCRPSSVDDDREGYGYGWTLPTTLVGELELEELLAAQAENENEGEDGDMTPNDDLVDVELELDEDDDGEDDGWERSEGEDGVYTETLDVEALDEDGEDGVRVVPDTNEEDDNEDADFGDMDSMDDMEEMIRSEAEAEALGAWRSEIDELYEDECRSRGRGLSELSLDSELAAAHDPANLHNPYASIPTDNLQATDFNARLRQIEEKEALLRLHEQALLRLQRDLLRERVDLQHWRYSLAVRETNFGRERARAAGDAWRWQRDRGPMSIHESDHRYGTHDCDDAEE